MTVAGPPVTPPAKRRLSASMSAPVRSATEVAALLLSRPDIWPLVAKYGRESVLKRLGRLGFHGLRA